MFRLLAPFVLVLGLVGVAQAADTAAAKTPDWSFNASIIEACSCPMFCQCYFDSKPASHAAADASMKGMDMSGHEGHMHGAGGETYCKFNNAFKVNKGSYGSTKLDGVKFWAAGDLGSDFSTGQLDWVVVTFDPSVTKEQREAVAAIMPFVYPAKWNSFTVAPDAAMSWEKQANTAHASLDGGKVAEVDLKAPAGRNNASQPMVIQNLKYWGVPRNDGFVLMGPNNVEAYRAGDKAFEFKGTNGFFITIDINSKDVASAAGSSSKGGGY